MEYFFFLPELCSGILYHTAISKASGSDKMLESFGISEDWNHSPKKSIGFRLVIENLVYIVCLISSHHLTSHTPLLLRNPCSLWTVLYYGVLVLDISAVKMPAQQSSLALWTIQSCSVIALFCHRCSDSVSIFLYAKFANIWLRLSWDYSALKWEDINN